MPSIPPTLWESSPSIQFEREVSGERIRDKIAASNAKELWIGGCPPLGYDVVEKKLVPNKKEAELVRTIFEKYLELGSIRALYEFVLNENIRSKKRITKDGRSIGGAIIQPSTLAKILRSKVYIGRIEYKKEKKSYPGQHKPIIDKKLFDQVQFFLDSNQNKFNETHETNGNLLSGKIFDDNGNSFKNQKSSKNGNRKYRYYALKNLYLPAGDIDEITVKVIKNFFDYYLDPILTKPQAHEFKSVDFNSFTYAKKSELTRAMIDKIIYHNSMMIYFIRVEDLSYLDSFKRENFLNFKGYKTEENQIDRKRTDNVLIKENSMDMKIYPSEDKRSLIIEEYVCINNRHLTNKFVSNSKKLISISENSNNLIKAISMGWKYGKMAENGISPKAIAINENKTARTVYRYMNLNYLSPNIINDIMDSRVPAHINLQVLFDIASKYADFIEQEKAFYGHSLK